MPLGRGSELFNVALPTSVVGVSACHLFAFRILFERSFFTIFSLFGQILSGHQHPSVAYSFT